MTSISRLSTAAQFFEEDGGGSEAISTYDRVSLKILMKVIWIQTHEILNLHLGLSGFSR